jgi:hypothetical protein
VLLLLAGAWKIIKWGGKRADRVIVAHVRMTRTFSKNDDRNAAALEVIAANDQRGHELTHQKLEVIHDDVRRITWVPPVLQGHPPSGPPGGTGQETRAGDAR